MSTKDAQHNTFKHIHIVLKLHYCFLTFSKMRSQCKIQIRKKIQPLKLRTER